MNIINALSSLAEQRVKKYGAQYGTFAIIGLINYPVAYIFEILARGSNEGVWFRLISTALCLLLFFRDKWPKKLKRYLPLYWYSTLIFGIPVMASYMALKNNLSFEWLMNANTGILIIILLVDSIMALAIEIIGIVIGIAIFYALGNSASYVPDPYYPYMPLYMFICIVLFGTIFTRNKEIYNAYLLKARDEINDKLELLVKERTLELQEALSFKTKFLNNMSHEIRTPVQGIHGISEGLVANWEKFNDKKKFDSAKLVAKGADRLLSLVGNLLDISKFSAGKMLLDIDAVDMNKALDDMIEECKTLYLQDKKIKFKFAHAKNTIIAADRERIAQVMRNLFFNAIKFSPSGSTITATINTSTLPKDSGAVPAIHVAISDQGVGVPEKDLDTIFSPFIQSSITETKAGGTGLGLTISQQIIEAHGGRIWVYNNPEGGAVFNFLLPMHQPDHVVKQVIKPRVDENAPITLLAIDDEESLLVSVEMMLMGTKFELVKARSGREALEYLKDHKVDIILLDLMMPDMYGLDVLAALKADEALKEIPVILQSGTSDEAAVKKAYEMGIAAWVKKPYRKASVLATLQSIGA